MKKKILFLSPLPPPHYGSALSSKMCLNILKNSKDFEVRNIQLNYSKEMKDVGRINISKIKGIFAVSKKIKEEIKSFKPDIIYFMPATSSLGLFRDNHFVKQIKKFSNKKILFHIRARITEEDWQKKTYRKNYIQMFKNQKAIILDDSLKKDLHNLIPEDSISVLPNAIENKISKPELERIIKNRRKNKKLNLLFLSNMDESKGWIKVIAACKLLQKRNIKFHCNFVGAWPSKKEEQKFYHLIKKFEIEKNVSYLGKKTGKEKNQILEKSDILVFPTDYRLETFGRVIIEAMMFGLPVIANGIASIPSIIGHNQTGFVLKENSPSEIVDYVEKLKNKNVREKLGKESRERFLKNYELKNYSDKFLKIFYNH